MKVIGVGLNKTGTKTLRAHLMDWGFRHRSYELDAFKQFRRGQIEELLDSMDQHDSFEDWPWPLMYQEIDRRFPDARFVLTTRKTADHWYRSLCKMAVRMGPLNDFEIHIYGHAMPHGKRSHHIDFYEQHNQQVRDYFRDRPGKLLQVCWEDGGTPQQLAEFLNLENVNIEPQHRNPGLPVYSGDNLAMAHLSRIAFQSKWKLIRGAKKIARMVRGKSNR